MTGTGGLVRFSSSEIDAAFGEGASVEEVYAIVTRMNIASVSDAPLDVEMTLRFLPGLSIAAISTSPYRIERTNAQTVDGDDDFVLTIPRRAGIAARQPGREAELRTGEAFLWLSDERWFALAPQATSLINITVPRATIEPAIADLDAVLKDRLPASTELALLTSYAEALMAEAPLTPEIEALAAGHLRDLIIATLGAKKVERIAAGRGVGAARLAAIKRDILENLADPSLSIQGMAVRHGISTHYIRALFSRDGTAFTDYVREQRLLRAFKHLSDRHGPQRHVSAIAYTCGFSDLSWFNQAFKRRFGRAPSDVREGGDPEPGPCNA